MTENTNGMTQELNFNVGLLGPTATGKTSLISAMFHELRDKLVGNEGNVDFSPADGATRNAIQNAISSFKACTAGDAIVPLGLMGTMESYLYKFCVSIPSPQGESNLNIVIRDYRGGDLLDENCKDVKRFIDGCSVLLVPISSDILMRCFDTNGQGGRFQRQENKAARNQLLLEQVVVMTRDWIAKRTAKKQPSILIFVPVKCEIYFNDNGGHVDKSSALFEAVKRFYVDKLELTSEQRKYIQIETHAVDTYGIVELAYVKMVDADNEGNGVLKATFRKRLWMNEDLKIKGAAELLLRAMRFNVGKEIVALREEIEKNKDKIRDRGFLVNLIKGITARFFPDHEKESLALLNIKILMFLEAIGNEFLKDRDETTDRIRIENMASISTK